MGHWRCARLIRVFGDVGSGPLECACDGGSRDGGGRSISSVILACPLSSGRESRKLAVRTGRLFVKGEMYRFTRFPLYFPGGVLFALRDPGPKNVEKPNAISAKGESCIRVLSVSVCLLPCLLMLRRQSAFAWRNSFFSSNAFRHRPWPMSLRASIRAQKIAGSHFKHHCTGKSRRCIDAHFRTCRLRHLPG